MNHKRQIGLICILLPLICTVILVRKIFSKKRPGKAQEQRDVELGAVKAFATAKQAGQQQHPTPLEIDLMSPPPTYEASTRYLRAARGPSGFLI